MQIFALIREVEKQVLYKEFHILEGIINKVFYSASSL